MRAKKINFLSLSSCVNNREQVIQITYANKIVRKNKQQIRVENEVKKFSFTFDKRVTREDFTTVPFGYLEARNDERDVAV